MPDTSLKSLLTKKASEAGFDIVRVTDPGAIADVGRNLFEYLENGFHGDMRWMEERAEARSDPRQLWPEVQSVVMLGLNYAVGDDPLVLLEQKSQGNISVYARGKDYHDVVKKKLKEVGRWLHEETGQPIKVFVDTAPVMEKPLAAASGIGWQGKHTNLVSRDFGSWLFLGAIYTAATIEPDEPETDHCGSCRRCLDICPTDAFPAPYQLDARRCISYLTIEHKGPIPIEFREAIGNRIYGCDDCLAVCPWNKWAEVSREAKLQPRQELRGPDLLALLSLDDAEFRKLFAGSPIKRVGRDRFMRNVLIAAGNSGDGQLAEAVEGRLNDEAPIVRAMAIWALAKLVSDDYFLEIRERYLDRESDQSVKVEWMEGYLP